MPSIDNTWLYFVSFSSQWLHSVHLELCFMQPSPSFFLVPLCVQSEGRYSKTGIELRITPPKKNPAKYLSNMSDAVDSVPALGTKLSMTVRVLKRNLRCGPLVNHQHISENLPLAGDIISSSLKILSYRGQTLYIFEKTAFQNRVS